MTTTTEKDRLADALETVAENNADPIEAALADARETIRVASSINPGAEFTSDTVLPDLSPYGFTDGRAVGSIMRRLVASGDLVKVPGRYRPSTRKGNHLTPRQVYRVNAPVIHPRTPGKSEL